MFDVGSMEILLIFIIILVVAGPERLPGIVRTIGRWVGYAKHTMTQFRQEFENEFDVAELRKELQKATNAEDIKLLKDEINSIEANVHSEINHANQQLHEANAKPLYTHEPENEMVGPMPANTSNTSASSGKSDDDTNKSQENANKTTDQLRDNSLSDTSRSSKSTPISESPQSPSPDSYDQR